jgi:hypothetical protein
VLDQAWMAQFAAREHLAGQGVVEAPAGEEHGVTLWHPGDDARSPANRLIS